MRPERLRQHLYRHGAHQRLLRVVPCISAAKDREMDVTTPMLKRYAKPDGAEAKVMRELSQAWCRGTFGMTSK